MITEKELSKLDTINANDLAKLDNISEADIQRLNNLTDEDVARLNNITDADVARLNNITDADVARLNNLTDADVNKIQSITNDDIQSVKAMESPKNAAAGTVLTADGAGKAIYKAIQSAGSGGAIYVKDPVEAGNYLGHYNIYMFYTPDSQGLISQVCFLIGKFDEVDYQKYSLAGIVIFVNEINSTYLMYKINGLRISYSDANKKWTFPLNQQEQQIFSNFAILSEQERDRWNHCITLEDSNGKILFTGMMRYGSDTECTSLSQLTTLFGGGIYVGNGEYAKLDLTGGSEATAKLIKLDKTEVAIRSLGTITYTDKVFLSHYNGM